jgi:Tfp pilus assembly protein PilF
MTRRVMSAITAAAALLAAGTLLLGGCAGPGSGPYEPRSEAQRNTTRAEALNRDAAELIGSDDEGAEKLLREALTEDLFFGPAHNNLGVVFLEQGKLYEAAAEFEWARKLMPGHPDPRVNLALCMEQAGRVDDALESYEAALQVWPEYLPAVQGIARATVRARREDPRLARWLEVIAMQGGDERWVRWARERGAAGPR